MLSTGWDDGGWSDQECGAWSMDAWRREIPRVVLVTPPWVEERYPESQRAVNCDDASSWWSYLMLSIHTLVLIHSHSCADFVHEFSTKSPFSVS